MVTTLFITAIYGLITVVAVLAILVVVHLAVIAVRYALHVYTKVTKR